MLRSMGLLRTTDANGKPKTLKRFSVNGVSQSAADEAMLTPFKAAGCFSADDSDGEDYHDLEAIRDDDAKPFWSRIMPFNPCSREIRPTGGLRAIRCPHRLLLD